MKFLFIVHGNGNGHQTQALALQEELVKRGHTVEKCLLTSSGNTRKGNLLSEEFEDFSTINGLELNYKDGVLDFGRTVWKNFLKSPFILWSMSRIKNMIRFYQPDLVVSFYDPLYFLAKSVYNLSVPYVSIGHMYMFNQENFGIHEYDTRLSFLKIYNRITSIESRDVYSLNYSESSDESVKTVGPILRDSFLNDSYIEEENDHGICGYFHHLSDAKRFCEALTHHPSFKATFFSNTSRTINYSNSTIRPISRSEFLPEVEKNKYFVSSSGFESTSESIFLGKKSMIFPISNHIEQELNTRCLEKRNLAYPVYSWNNIESDLVKFLFDFEADRAEVEKFQNHVLFSKDKLVIMIEKNA